MEVARDIKSTHTSWHLSQRHSGWHSFFATLGKMTSTPLELDLCDVPVSMLTTAGMSPSATAANSDVRSFDSDAAVWS